MKKKSTTAFILFGPLFVIFLVSGCGPSAQEIATQTAEAWTPTPTNTPIPTDTPTPLPPTETPTPDPADLAPSPTDILESMNSAMQDVSSFHFEMIIEMGMAMEGLTLEIPLSLIGDYQAPDRMHAVLTMNFLGSTMETEMITIGDTSYVTDPETGEWIQETADGTGIAPIDPGELIGPGEYELEDPVLVGIEEVDGVLAFHLSGTITSEEFEGLLGEDGGGGSIVIDYWIGLDDFLLRKIAFTAEFYGSLMEEMEGSQDITMSVEIVISDFNKEVNIEAPID